ncbi:hypothetical protein LOTGIDRAFT_239540 [Lottia gigantea]|uniref:Uncharacterized protein n=1 Tax=Lottia gigantea TaxID=225164 RepID=V4AKJ5_LOTGI|nr:hypothetical protein LOTGIDRAFT_239540 [Lottia gigantea]ESO94081.1 hypothetical protein LOTGIDRAFT_239540 [Lottia gigantea]
MDMITKRPLEANTPYTVLTDEQLRNIKKDSSPFFMGPAVREEMSEERKRTEQPIKARFAYAMSSTTTRGGYPTEKSCYIGEQFSRFPDPNHDTCRLGAGERWGPQKAGSRTLHHYEKEQDPLRYTTIDMYRRPNTNLPGPNIMKFGRAADGFYQEKFPNRLTTRFTA